MDIFMFAALMYDVGNKEDAMTLLKINVRGLYESGLSQRLLKIIFVIGGLLILLLTI